MIRRPPRSTRTDTLFPYTTRFRSAEDDLDSRWSHHDESGEHDHDDFTSFSVTLGETEHPEALLERLRPVIAAHGVLRVKGFAARSEERRVGKECVSTCRSRWSPYH